MTMSQNAMAATLALTTALAPLAVSAQGNGGGNGHANGKARAVQPAKTIAVRHENVRSQPLRANALGCPTGVAKTAPACVISAQAKKQGFAVGDVLDWSQMHVVTDPGLYGLSIPPDGSRYAIVDGKLIRVHAQTGRVLSVIRMVEAILD